MNRSLILIPPSSAPWLIATVRKDLPLHEKFSRSMFVVKLKQNNPSHLGLMYHPTMPTVMRIRDLRVVIYPNDHRPAHVHVIGTGCEGVFNLHCPNGPPELRENFSFSARQLAAIRDALIAETIYLCNEWRKIHGAL